MVLKWYATCPTISKSQPYNNENSVSTNGYIRTHKIDADYQLHTYVCEALSIEMTVLKIYLRNYYREERLSAIAQMILHRDVKVNYKKLVDDFLRRKQHCQLFIPIELFLKYNTWPVFYSDNATTTSEASCRNVGNFFVKI